jgi:hypothetical protein
MKKQLTIKQIYFMILKKRALEVDKIMIVECEE